VSILAGSSETNEQPTKESAKADRGSQVVILGEARYTDKGVWLPILPQPKEVRFIPEAAVKPAGTAPAVAAVTSVPPANNGPPGTPVIAPAPGAGAADAREEQRKNLQKAADLETDPARRAQILQLLAGLQTGTPPIQQPGHPNNVGAWTDPSGRIVAMPVAAAAQGNGGTTSLYNTGNPSTGPASTASGAAQWSQWGQLRRTAFKEADGRPVYALVDPQGRSQLYATSLPNYTLESYVGCPVCLYGTITYRQDDRNLRANVMTVYHVSVDKKY
jgi:hypothetical protein